jgi:hypothetical protein
MRFVFKLVFGLAKVWVGTLAAVVLGFIVYFGLQAVSTMGDYATASANVRRVFAGCLVRVDHGDRPSPQVWLPCSDVDAGRVLLLQPESSILRDQVATLEVDWKPRRAFSADVPMTRLDGAVQVGQRLKVRFEKSWPALTVQRSASLGQLGLLIGLTLGSLAITYWTGVLKIMLWASQRNR